MVSPVEVTVVYEVLKALYEPILRELLLKAIDDPDSKVDDFVVKLFDILLDYQEKKNEST